MLRADPLTEGDSIPHASAATTNAGDRSLNFVLMHRMESHFDLAP